MNKQSSFCDIEELVDQLSKKEGFHTEGSQDLSRINEVETCLDISFTDDYKYLLQKWGFLEWFGHSVYGISSDEECDTLYVTQYLRSKEWPSNFKPIDLSGNVIEMYSGGGYYFLFSKDSSRAGEVALFVDELFGREVESWSSFVEYLHYKGSL